MVRSTCWLGLNFAFRVERKRKRNYGYFQLLKMLFKFSVILLLSKHQFSFKFFIQGNFFSSVSVLFWLVTFLEAKQTAQTLTRYIKTTLQSTVPNCPVYTPIFLAKKSPYMLLLDTYTFIEKLSNRQFLHHQK